MPEHMLTTAEMHECRTRWLSHADLNAGFDVAAQHAAMLGARKALSDPHAATIDEAMEILKHERHRVSELERQYAEAKDAISLEPLTHPQFMDALRAMRQKNADLQTFLQISDDARVNMMERMATLTHWKENAIRQMAELEKEQRHLHSLLKLMHSTMKEIESINELLTRP